MVAADPLNLLKVLWGGDGGIVSVLRQKIGADNVSKSTVKGVLRRTVAAILGGHHSFDDAGQASNRSGRPLEITGVDRQIIASELHRGAGLEFATDVLNMHRAAHGRRAVTLTGVAKAAQAIGGKAHRRQTKAQGNTDPESAWAVARLAQVQQLKMQLCASSRKRKRRGTTLPHTPLESILFVDEKNVECMVGWASSWEWLFYVDAVETETFVSPDAHDAAVGEAKGPPRAGEPHARCSRVARRGGCRDRRAPR